MQKYQTNQQTLRDFIKPHPDIQTKLNQISQTINQKFKSFFIQQIANQFKTLQNKKLISKVQWTAQISKGLQSFIQNSKDILNKFSQNIVFKLKNLINIQSNAFIKTLLKQFVVEQLPKYNKEQIIQAQLQLNTFAQYLKDQSRPILQTIFKNIQMDYPGSYTKENVVNVMNLYSKAHSFNDKRLIKKYYQQEKTKWFNQYKNDKAKYKNELKILQWFEKQRGVKYDNNNPNGSTQIVHKVSPQISICNFTKDLVGAPKMSRRLDTVHTHMKPLQNRYYYFEIIKSRAINSSLNFPYRLVFQKNNKNKQLPSIWIAQFTMDGRLVWRADSQVDHIDVKNLLQFILMTKWPYEQSKQNFLGSQNICPSIVINAGSHGVRQGGNAYENCDENLIDERIINQTKQVVYQIIQQVKARKLNPNLTEKNIANKILISQMSQQRHGVYPIKANHIIDVQCYGAFSKIKSDYLTNSNRQITCLERDLIFLFQGPQIFKNSQIIKNKRDEQKLMNAIGITQPVRSNHRTNELKNWKFNGQWAQQAKLLYRASDNDYSVQKYLQLYASQTDTIFIIKTNRNKIIGAYTPISFSWNQKQNSLHSVYGKDPSKKSFIFTMTQNQKFLIKDQTMGAILRYKNNYFNQVATITFGNEELKLSYNSNYYPSSAKAPQQSGYKWSQKYKSKPISEKQSARKAHRLFMYDFINNDTQDESAERPYRLFNGNKDEYFTTKEWQVWKIIWKP